jgi:nicotinamidase-related amidase
MKRKKRMPVEVALVAIDHQHEFWFPGGPVTPNTGEDILRLSRFIHQLIADNRIKVIHDLDDLPVWSVVHDHPDWDSTTLWPDHNEST